MPVGCGDVAPARQPQERQMGAAQGRHDLRSGATANRARVLAARHIAHVVQAVLNRPMTTRQLQQAVGGNARRQTRDEIADLAGGLPLLDADPLQPQHLPRARPAQIGQIAVESGRGPQPPLLVAAAVVLMGAGVGERFAGRGLVKEQRHLGQKRGLIAFDDEVVVAPGRANLRAQPPLAKERVARHHPPSQRQRRQQGGGQRQFGLVRRIGLHHLLDDPFTRVVIPLRLRLRAGCASPDPLLHQHEAGLHIVRRD